MVAASNCLSLPPVVHVRTNYLVQYIFLELKKAGAIAHIAPSPNYLGSFFRIICVGFSKLGGTNWILFDVVLIQISPTPSSVFVAYPIPLSLPRATSALFPFF